MHAIKKVSISALICGATLLVIGGASALPLGAGQASIGVSANDANGFFTRTACGPNGCTPGGTQVPQQRPQQRGGGGTTGWGGAGINLGLDLLQGQIERDDAGPPANWKYIEMCTRRGLEAHFDGTRVRCSKKMMR
jgi:hypothetical protein